MILLRVISSYLTKLKKIKLLHLDIINDDNIDKIVQLGRNRWKIENQGFYTQKHRTFDITHLNSRNDNSMKYHYYFIQFAHTIRQLLEQGNLLTKSLNYTIFVL